MDANILGILGFAAVFLLIFIRVPIAFAFGFVGFAGIWHMASFKAAISTLISTTWSYSTSYVLMAIPLFVMMGQFASHSRIGAELYDTAAKWLSKLPGGLAIATVWGSASFAACTGSSTAGILTFTPIAYKPMRDSGYDQRIILGTLCCGATMGTLIPPSITFIIYGSITDESVGKLFMAGFIPGILEAALYSAIIIILGATGIWAAPKGQSATWKEKITSLKGIWGFVSLMVLVIGGIYLGLFTPTEAAGVGAAGALAILLWRSGWRIALIRNAILDCMRTTCMALTIIICSIVFARFVAMTGLNMLVMDLISSSGASPMVILWMVLAIMFLLGFIMPVTSILVLIVPFVYPIVMQVFKFSYAGIWFGVLTAIMAEIAVITPPIGMNLFVTIGLLRKDANEKLLFQGVFPFVVADLIRLLLIVLFPAICLWLPKHM
jgi:C4-dicarboxylate transporter DctM subunit